MTKKLENYWLLTQQRRRDPSGKTIAMDSFLLEEKDFISIVVREIVQNVLDARKVDVSSGQRKTATLKIAILNEKNGLSRETLDKYTAPLVGHLVAAKHDPNLMSEDYCGALVIEEFETTGLIGETEDSRYDLNEDFQRWNNFWHGEAKEIKGGRSLGRRGQGTVRINHLVQQRVEN